MTLRHGFITVSYQAYILEVLKLRNLYSDKAFSLSELQCYGIFFQAHLAPGSETRFDFQKYISRSLDEDFKVVVGIRSVLTSI